METEQRPFVGFVNAKPKLSVGYQKQQLIAAGCQAEKVLDDFDTALDATRDYFPLIIWRVDILGDTLRKDGPRPRDTFKRRVTAIRVAGVAVYEASGDRWWHHDDNFTDAMFDAWDRFSQGGPSREQAGRPPKEMTPEQIDHARLVWTSTQYATNAEAFEALKALGWSKWLMQKYKIGKSGRLPGKPKSK